MTTLRTICSRTLADGTPAGTAETLVAVESPLGGLLDHPYIATVTFTTTGGGVETYTKLAS